MSSDFNPNEIIYVTIGMSLASAKELEMLLKPIAIISDSPELNTIMDMLQKIQELPGIIQEYENEIDYDSDEYWGDANPSGVDPDQVRYSNSNFFQNWRLN